MKKTLSIAALALAVARAGAIPVPPCEIAQTEHSDRYEIGLSFQALHPNHLPDDPANMPVYGPRIGIPLFGNTLYVQGLYGSADPISAGATTIVLTEVGYQIPIELPFFHTFIEGGGHYLHYSKPGVIHDMFGGNFGFGLLLPMGRDFKLALALKTYLQERTMISMGGGFSILL